MLSIVTINDRKFLGLSKRTSEVFHFITKEGPLNIYQIRKSMKSPSYSTVHKAVKILESRGLIKVRCVKQTEKGVNAKVYELTFFGLLYALIYLKTWPDFLKVASAWENLAPIPLQKYSYFVKLDLKENAIKAYRNASLNTLKELTQLYEMIENWLDSPKRINEILEKNMENIENQAKEVWNNYFLESILEPQPPDIRIKWYKAFRSDPELKEWIIKKLKNKALRHHTRAQIIEEVVGLIEQPHEPNWEEIKKKGIRWQTEIVWKLRS